MELTEARALVKDKTDKDITVRHLISVEGVMRALGGWCETGWWGWDCGAFAPAACGLEGAVSAAGWHRWRW